jgi:hypothetical protein
MFEFTTAAERAQERARRNVLRAPEFSWYAKRERLAWALPATMAAATTTTGMAATAATMATATAHRAGEAAAMTAAGEAATTAGETTAVVTAAA